MILLESLANQALAVILVFVLEIFLVKTYLKSFSVGLAVVVSAEAEVFVPVHKQIKVLM